MDTPQVLSLCRITFLIASAIVCAIGNEDVRVRQSLLGTLKLRLDD